MSKTIREKVEKARSLLLAYSPVIVAFSGGTDSAFLLKLSLDALGKENVLAVAGISPSMADAEQSAAEKLALQFDAPFLSIATGEMENENYRSNPRNRCFFCKEELFSKLEKLRADKKYKTVLDGTNADDARDWRPGMEAAQKFNVRSPLLEACLTKEEIRTVSREWNLPTWNKPAMPCLSSRIPYGESITPERLSRVDNAEKLLREQGFRELRVRDHFPIARIEVLKEEMEAFAREPLRGKIVEGLQSLGYRFVTLDLSGFQSGSLNQI